MLFMTAPFVVVALRGAGGNQGRWAALNSRKRHARYRPPERHVWLNPASSGWHVLRVVNAGRASLGPMTGRVEEILEVAALLDEMTEKLAVLLECSGADQLHGPETLREITRRELDVAMVDVACLTFGSPMHE